MNFIVDAQLPRKLILLLREAGHDALHILDLPSRNRTSDAEINSISITEHRVVITKDSDFVDSFLLQNRPWKLLLMSTGNISNRDLEKLFIANLSLIVNGLSNYDYLELTRTNVIFHS
jgi:predicted nuclease of predicted toxin-antitoxin system